MIVAPQLEADVDVRIAPKVRPHAVQRKTDGIRIRGTRSGTAKAIHPVRRFRSDTDRRPRDFDVKTGTRLRGHCPTKARIALQEWSLSVRVRPQAPRLRRAASRLWGLTAQRDRANSAAVAPKRLCDAVTDESSHFVGRCPTGPVLVFSDYQTKAGLCHRPALPGCCKHSGAGSLSACNIITHPLSCSVVSQPAGNRARQR